MKTVRRVLILLLISTIAVYVLTGCSKIPEEYTEGVKLHRSYPDDDIPIYNDTVVYYCEDDDGSVTIKYGSDDELDDVADFYKDHFENNKIALSDETDKNTRYAAQGSYKDFKFEVKVTEPSGDYEEKVFSTVVKVEIEFIDNTHDTQYDSKTGDQLIGFWRQESYEDHTGKVPTYDTGSAYEFLTDGTLNLYHSYRFVGSGKWSVVDSSTLLLNAIDGTPVDASISLEVRNGKDYLTLIDPSGTMIFFKDSKDEFSMSVFTEVPEMDDAQLSVAISESMWHFIEYSIEGLVHNSSNGHFVFNTDGSFKSVYENESDKGEWYISDGTLYCNYEDGESSSWVIDIQYRGTADFLLLLNPSHEETYWEYATYPRGSVVLYTEDQDMTSAIADKHFNALYYMFADGSKDTLDNNPFILYADHSFEELCEEELLTGTWQFNNGYLEYTYDNGNAFHFPAYVEYNNVTDTYYLFLGDLTVGNEHCYWIFETYQP